MWKRTRPGLGTAVILLTVLAALIAVDIFAASQMRRAEPTTIVLSKDEFRMDPSGSEILSIIPGLRSGTADDRFPVVINEHGFRSRPFTPKGEILRVVLLGDSIAFGVGLPIERTLGVRIEQELARAGRPTEVFNLGVPTFWVGQMVRTWERFGEALEPDLVLLQVECGDFHRGQALVLERWTQVCALTRWIDFRLKRMRAEPFAPDEGVEPYRGFADTLSRAGVPLIVVHFPLLAPKESRLMCPEEKAELAAGAAALVDVESILEATGRPLPGFRVNPTDTIHPDSETIDLTAAVIASQILSLSENPD